MVRAVRRVVNALRSRSEVAVADDVVYASFRPRLAAIALAFLLALHLHQVGQRTLTSKRLNMPSTRLNPPSADSGLEQQLHAHATNQLRGIAPAVVPLTLDLGRLQGWRYARSTFSARVLAVSITRHRKVPCLQMEFLVGTTVTFAPPSRCPLRHAPRRSRSCGCRVRSRTSRW
jgi:hypothetical protein